ncbi:hypothetical protein [Nonomuraea jabiensis]|uniref:Uncharacterized protein n=1 Tax=Nonomuraea jabiensis TaxID=882448 RepID=A0A7W9FYU9_9ACTN|nr:hypothetical protein [Nonomuraea jabiensis]MBB5774068.1 hypothetical protein [Nonomuraea jabiensis]
MSKAIPMLDTPPLPWSYQPIRDLCRHLAGAYQDGNQARVLAASVEGFPVLESGIDWRHSSGEPLWEQIMSVAARAGKLRTLVDAVLADTSVAGYHDRIRSALHTIEVDTSADVSTTSDSPAATVSYLPINDPQWALNEVIAVARRTRGELPAGDPVTLHRLLRSLSTSLKDISAIAPLLSAPRVNTMTRAKEQTSELLTALRTANAIDAPKAERARARRTVPSLIENLRGTLQKLVAESDATTPHER